MNPTHLTQSVTELPLDRRRARRNVLVVALDGVVPDDVPGGRVLVVAPALNSWLRHWLSDEDAARRRAGQRIAAWLDGLERRGVSAEGRIGDADPLRAIADALVTFPADEILLAADPDCPPRPDEELLPRARRRFPNASIRAARPSLARAA